MTWKYEATYTDVGEIVSEIDGFSDRVAEVIKDQMLSHAVELILHAQGCESPIEQLLMIGLKVQEDSCIMMADENCYVINPQYEIKVNENTFRVDFLICAMFQGNKRNVVVECDGHEFHERTKKQATRDKQRDRILLKSWYEVIRFTGSEIYENPYYCAKQVNDIVFKSG